MASLAEGSLVRVGEIRSEKLRQDYIVNSCGSRSGIVNESGCRMKHVLHDGIPYKINMAAMRTVRIEEEVPSKSRSYWQCTRGHGISNRRVKTLEKGDTIGTAFCIKCGCHRAVTLTTIEGIKMEKPVVAPSEWSHS